MFSVRNMYPFWFITWDDFPLRNCCSESAHVRNGERHEIWEQLKIIYWDIPYELEVLIQVSMGHRFCEFSIPPFDCRRVPPKKTGLLNIQHDRSCVHWCLPFSSLAIDWIARTLGVPRSKKSTAPKDGDGFSNKHNCELPHRPLAIEECA